MKCCIECVASSAYSCFSRTTLTVLAVLKVLISVSIIIIVAVKLENVTIAVQLPVASLADLTTVAGLANVTNSLLGSTPPAAGASAGGGGGSSSGGGGTDLNATAGPIHVDAACLLQKRGDAGQFDGDSKTMCSYVYGVCAISLAATFVMAGLLWCTCHLCGWGPLLELAFAVLGCVWWMVAALVLQEHTAIAVDTGPAAVRLIMGNALPPPPAAAGALFSPPPPPPPVLAPSANASTTAADGDLAAQLGELLHEWMPTSIHQWRNTVVGLSWCMMVMFGGAGLLLAVEACGCLVEVVACCCRCCCCPNRPESKWRSRFSNTRRKRVDGEEYMEMAAGIPNSSASPSGGGAAPLSSPPVPMPPPGPIMAPPGPPGGYGAGGHGFGPGAYSGGRGAYSSASAAPPSVVVAARSGGYGGAAMSWADREREEREKRAPGGWGY
ncbi:hypothetical protein HYH02_003878 [Chlamydomonas schloesseri]|uniref:Uncharacterized protein n=1 Tax=Chlamydomonas schloesseri TaxID=2026947 RepID=A0A835WPL3_9CHLO|nr:hypothetical protein HYH02_003878 [Chlamydomonas schloesseri]|eukprot:KAG2451271.1 hypothetical protein HYH02_003878 [Chlamydomonas schloesseri]